jgi:hypothetical protein
MQSRLLSLSISALILTSSFASLASYKVSPIGALRIRVR